MEYIGYIVVSLSSKCNAKLDKCNLDRQMSVSGLMYLELLCCAFTNEIPLGFANTDWNTYNTEYEAVLQTPFKRENRA